MGGQMAFGWFFAGFRETHSVGLKGRDSQAQRCKPWEEDNDGRFPRPNGP